MKTKMLMRRLLVVLFVSVWWSAQASAQETDTELHSQIEALRQGQEQIQQQMQLYQEIQELKQGQQEIRKQLDELQRLVQARPAAAAQPGQAAQNVKDVIFDLGANHVKGDSTAKITLVEFSDYECPFCARHLRETFPKIENEYIDTGRLRYAMLDMPLGSIHKLAFKAAEASHCAGDQGKFWEMHDRLFENQRSLEPWSAHAEALGMDVAKFEECLNSGRHAPAIRRDIAQAQKARVRATPSFVLARTDPTDPTKLKGLTFIRGAASFDSFKAAIDDALKAEGD